METRCGRERRDERETREKREMGRRARRAEEMHERLERREALRMRNAGKAMTSRASRVLGQFQIFVMFAQADIQSLVKIHA